MLTISIRQTMRVPWKTDSEREGVKRRSLSVRSAVPCQELFTFQFHCRCEVDGTRPAIFKWRQTELVLILSAVRWYLRYSLSLRDVEELLKERGLEADHTTVWRWVQRYGPELEQRMRQHLKPTNKSWRVDETYVRVQGR
jgi:hypothetical protein